MPELKEIQEELQKTLHDFRQYVDKELKEIKEKGHADPETTEALAKANARIDELQAKIQRPPVADTKESGLISDRKEISDFMRKGHISEAGWARAKAMSVGSDSDGGFWVSPDTGGRIVQKLWELVPFRQVCDVVSTSKDKKTGRTDLDETDANWEGETTSPAETDTPQVGKWEIPVFELRARPKITQQDLDDSDVDVASWLEAKISSRFGRKENAAFAAGTGAGQPKGITTYTAVTTADATRAWGQVQYIASGTAGDWTAANVDKIHDLTTALKAGYRQNAKFIGPKELFLKVRKMKDGNGQWLWQPSMQAGTPSQLAGYSFLECEDMPAIAANSLSLAFADWKEAYTIVDRMGIRVLRDPFSSKPYIEFYTTKRTGGGLINSEAIKFLKFAAA